MNERQQEQEVISPPTSPRRSVFRWLWRGIGIMAFWELGWIGGSILKSGQRKKEKRINTIIDAGMTADYKLGSVKAVPQGQLYVTCLEDGSFLALSRTCTHLGCSVPWDDKEKKFVCPCHGSTFDLTGSVLSPPAIRPLDYFPVRIENGLIRINVAKPLRREIFASSQTTRA